MNKILLLLLLLTIGCQNDEEGNDDMGGEMPPTGLLDNNLFMSQGLERDYHLFVPENYSNAALVIIFHGNGSNFDDVAGLSNVTSPFKLWRTIAEEEDLILLVPNGTLGSNDKRGWNDCRSDASSNPTVDDLLFIGELLQKISEDYDFDEKRVYATGISNGGHMAIRLGLEMPARIAAFAAIAASMSGNSNCAESTEPVSALIMNGTDDPFLPFAGGEMVNNRGLVLSTSESIAYWAGRNETDINPTQEMLPDNNTDDNCTATKYSYGNGKNNTEVVLYQIENGGHSEPSLQEQYGSIFLAFVGNQNWDFEMAEVVWDFFKTKSK